jgi:uncharacterized membrane protein YeaQ/YmgE (transglycosylase-associated protein family)
LSQPSNYPQAPQPGAYPQSPQPGAFPPPSPYGEQPQPQGSNGFAIAGLIFGIIGGWVLGLIFGILGLKKAKKVNKGKTMSIIAIVLSVLWIVPTIFIVKAVTDQVGKLTNPGCVSAEAAADSFSTKMNAAGNDVNAIKAEVQNIIKEMDDSAAKSNDAKATAAIKTFSADLKELQSALETGQMPPDLQTRLETDGAAVDTACGRVAS